jgi:hypothetical protein
MGQTIDDRRNRRSVLDDRGELCERIARTQRIHLPVEHAPEALCAGIDLRCRIGAVFMVRSELSHELAENAKTE